MFVTFGRSYCIEYQSVISVVQKYPPDIEKINEFSRYLGLKTLTCLKRRTSD